MHFSSHSKSSREDLKKGGRAGRERKTERRESVGAQSTPTLLRTRGDNLEKGAIKVDNPPGYCCDRETQVCARTS